MKRRAFFRWLAAAGALYVTAAPLAALRRHDAPARGRFLVAARTMDGSYFGRTVVLLLDHDAAGTLGVIVNRRTPLRAADVLDPRSAAGGRDDVLYEGGPVTRDQMIVLVNDPGQPPAGARPVGQDIYYSLSPHTLEQLFAEGLPAARLRLFVGHSGWAAGQLVGELERRAWHVVETELQAAFTPAPEELWYDWIQSLEPAGIRVRGPGDPA